MRSSSPRGAFAYPNYRRYWLSSVAMVLATQFRFIGAGWLVHQLTDSPFWLGVPGIISAVVTVLLMLPAGALADRVDNQHLLSIGRGLSGLAHLAIAMLTVTGVVEVWMVLVWAAVTGALGALTNPAQAALLPRLIDRTAMASAVALNGAIWNGMRIVGPAAAGLLIAAVGIGQAFFVTAAGYALSTFLTATLKLAPHAPESGAADSGMLAGVRYIAKNRIFFATIGLSFFTSLFGSSYVVLLPVFADDILHAGVKGFGFLEAAAGIGALLGTLSIVRIPTGRHTGAVMIGAALAFGLWIAGFSASRSLSLSMAFLFAGGFFASVYLNLGMTTLQLMVPGELRGRVMGVWGLTWFLSSAGGFVAASVAELLGAPLAVALGALSVSAFALLVYLRFEEIRGMPALDGHVGS
ncbi:MAG: MFS transporter [Myxococcota bacterium]